MDRCGLRGRACGEEWPFGEDILAAGPAAESAKRGVAALIPVPTGFIDASRIDRFGFLIVIRRAEYLQ